MIDYEKKISELDKDDVKGYLEKAFRQYALDCSQSLPAEELNNLVIRGYYKLTEDYPHWTLANVKYTLTTALNDDESKFNKLTVKNLFIWMRRAKDRFMKKDQEDTMAQFEQALSLINRTQDEISENSKLANGIIWKVANFGMGNKYPISQWDYFPLKHVVESLEKGIQPDDDIL